MPSGGTRTRAAVACVVLRECKEEERFYASSEFDPPPIVLEVGSLQLCVPPELVEPPIAARSPSEDAATMLLEPLSA